MSLLIHGGTLTDPAARKDGAFDVWIEGRKVHKVGKGLLQAFRRERPGAEMFDAKGLWVWPGVVDMHVHLREPGREADESIRSGTRAAAMGGVTSVLCMPNTEPVIDSAPLVRFVQTKAAADGLVNVFISGAVTEGQHGERLADIGKMARAGVKAISDDGHPVMNARLMRRALEYSQSFGLPVLDHCEDCGLSEGGAIYEGKTALRLGVPGIPPASEVTMARRDIELAALTGGRLHICHASCAGTVEAVREAKRRGVAVTIETAPHYFTLNEEDLPGFDANWKMNPPLAAKSDRAAILAGLKDGTIDAVATDHAPHSARKKALGLVDGPFGIIGLETLIPLSLDRLLHKKVVTRKRLVELLSTNPARILGLKGKGTLAPGADADVSVVAPNKPFEVPGAFASKSANSPFIGMRLRGAPAAAVVGGRLVMRDGRLL